MLTKICMKQDDIYNEKPVLRITKTEIMKSFKEDRTRCLQELIYLQDMYCHSVGIFYRELDDNDMQGLIDTLSKEPANKECFLEFRSEMDSQSLNTFNIVMGWMINPEKDMKKRASNLAGKLGYKISKLEKRFNPNGLDRYFVETSSGSFIGVGFTLYIDDVLEILEKADLERKRAQLVKVAESMGDKFSTTV